VQRLLAAGIVSCGVFSSSLIAQVPLPPAKETEKAASKERDKPLKTYITEPAAWPTLGGVIQDTAETPLSLVEVLQSVERNYPLLRSIEEDRRLAGGRLLTAMGAFDTGLTSGTSNLPLGTYEGYRYNVGLQQAYPTSGVTTFLNYRGGYGDYPSYNGGSKTADGGEIRGGVNIPFARNRDIDRFRANLQQAQIGVRAAEPIIDRARLDFQRAAARAYYAWLANGQQLRLAEKLLMLAKVRDDQLVKSIDSNVVRPLERVDNAQNIAARQTLLIRAQQAFNASSIELSLFMRTPDGRPIESGRKRVPVFPTAPKPNAEQIAQFMQLAEDTRPEVRRIRLQREALEVELRLANNDMKPIVNGFIVGSQDLGYSKQNTGPGRLDRSGLEAGIEVGQRIQQSDARGRIESLTANIRQLQFQEQFLRENIRTEVQLSFLSWNASYEVLEQANQRIGLAAKMVDAIKFGKEAGTENVLTATLRELALFDAEIIAVTAAFDTLRALAEFRIALGFELLEK
jgi:outer membrane protein, heavy metal efflux system